MLREISLLIEAIDKHLAGNNPAEDASPDEIDNYLLLASSYNLLSSIKIHIEQLSGKE